MSQLSPWFLKCSTRIPPWRCTIAFGSPVVPDEKSTYSGWSNDTWANSSGPDSATSDDHSTESGSESSSPPAYGTCTTCSTAGSAARISATSARLSTCFSP